MHILVANDDGILSPGLQVLAEACQTVGHVTVVAPDREQSAQSHALTMSRPLRPVLRPDGSWQVDGTPADCVLLALEVLMPELPAFVFSGINHGPNLGAGRPRLGHGFRGYARRSCWGFPEWRSPLPADGTT